MKAGIVLTYMDKIQAFMRRNRRNFVKFILIADCFAILLISPLYLTQQDITYACYSVKGSLFFKDSFFQTLKRKLATKKIVLSKETYCPQNSAFIITNTQRKYPYIYNKTIPIYLLNDTEKKPEINPSDMYVMAFTAKDQELPIFSKQINFNDSEKAAEIIADTIITKDFLSSYFFIRPLTNHGLGNQIFTLAAQLAYAKRFSKKMYFVDNGSPSYSVFNITAVSPKNMPKYLNLIDMLQQTNQQNHSSNSWKKNIQTFNADSLFSISGYMQSYFNIHDGISYLQKKLQFIPFTDQRNKELAKKIQLENSVCMHVRLGDYITHSYPILFWSDYFKTAIDYIKNKVKDPSFYVFSNDYNAVKNYDFGVPVQLINHNFGANSFRDMQLMSLCKHNIISNSTFSWWAAILNKNPNKIVIYPDIWLKWDAQWLEEMRVPGWIEIKSGIYIDRKKDKIVYPSKP